MAIQRKLYQKLEKHLSKKEFTIIIGPRQVGKTTLLKQLYDKVKKQVLIFRLMMEVLS